MPFIVDSVTMELGRQGYGIDLVIHPVMRVRRDADGQLIEVLEPEAVGPRTPIRESILHAEVAREHRPRPARPAAQTASSGCSADVRAAVEDWQQMRARTQELIERARRRAAADDRRRRSSRRPRRSSAWLAEDHFTFLGYREYDLVRRGRRGRPASRSTGSGLGILRGAADRGAVTKLSRQGARARPRAADPAPDQGQLARHRSTGPPYLDYIGVKKYSERRRR